MGIKFDHYLAKSLTVQNFRGSALQLKEFIKLSDYLMFTGTCMAFHVDEDVEGLDYEKPESTVTSCEDNVRRVYTHTLLFKPKSKLSGDLCISIKGRDVVIGLTGRRVRVTRTI